MADEKDLNLEDDQKTDGSKKKLIIFAAVVLIVMAVSIGGTFYFLGGMDEKTAETASTGEQSAPEPVDLVDKGTAQYRQLKPPIIVNFNIEGRQRFLQIHMSLMSRESDVMDALEIHMPLLRNNILSVVSGQDFDTLHDASGKKRLQGLVLKEAQRIMEEEIGKPGIEAIFFTNFVMQ